MRLFIAIDFSELRDYFTELQKQLPRNAKLSLAKSFHITLKFLGEVQPDKVEDIVSRLKSIKFGKISASLDSIGIFPTENYVRVVWVGIKPEDQVLELQKNIDESLKPLFRKEKEFKAHITLARAKYPEDKVQFVKELRMLNVEGRRIEIKDFRLIKSTLSQKGPVYEDLAVFNSSKLFK